jgi:hypothetical protein
MASKKRKPKVQTGWVAYRIAGRGMGLKEWHYLYMPGWEDEGADDLRSYIIHSHEDWALYTESYLWELDRNVEPPADVIRKKIAGLKASIRVSREEVETLTAQLPSGPT